MPVLPITYSELHNGEKPTDAQLSELIGPFNRDATFISLAMWNLMLSLSERNAEQGKAVQGFFIHNLIPHDERARVAAASPRPVFGRWPMLGLMKKVMLETTNDGIRDPRHDEEARRTLGNACLMMNDLLFPSQQDERFSAAAGDKEKIGDELMNQMLFQFELYNVPDAYQAIARNNEYFRIFTESAEEFAFLTNSH